MPVGRPTIGVRRHRPAVGRHVVAIEDHGGTLRAVEVRPPRRFMIHATHFKRRFSAHTEGRTDKGNAMDPFKADHRGHSVFAHASGPKGGPFIAMYTAWRVEPGMPPTLELQGSLPHEFATDDEAKRAAFGAACNSIDAALLEP